MLSRDRSVSPFAWGVLFSLIMTLITTLSLSWAQEPLPEPPVHTEQSAAQVYKDVLADQGLEAAVARFRGMQADTTGAFRISGRELILAARELAGDRQNDAAIAMFEILIELFPESPLPWIDLGNQYLGLDQPALADSCLNFALVLDPDNPHLQWTLQNLSGLTEIVRVQRDSEGRFEPGQNTGIKGPYLGEKPPTDAPRIFANGLINTPLNEFSLCFSPDGKEIYFSRSGEGILVCRWEAEGWTAPEVVRFFADDTAVDEPNWSPDGKWIFFNARPTISDERTIYRAPRVSDGWGEPEELFQGMFATAALSGSVYYTETTNRPDYGVIVRRLLTTEGYAEPETLLGGVQSEDPDAHPCIAPDESFLIFDSYRDQGNCGLFVAFPQPDGAWSEAVCLNHRLGIPPWAGQPALSPDGKYLFYSMEGDMYWVNVERLGEFQP